MDYHLLLSFVQLSLDAFNPISITEPEKDFINKNEPENHYSTLMRGLVLR